MKRQELENETHLKALREAAKIGVSDTPKSLRRHLAELAGDAVGGPNSER